MKKLRTLIFVILSLFVLTPIGCKKENALKEKSDRGPSFKALESIPSNILPDVNDGILCFRDIEHFHAYIDYINSNFGGLDSTDTLNPIDTLDIDQKLDLIEAELNYVSLRKTLNDVWDPIYEAGFSSPATFMDDFFIHDLGTRSVYNENRICKVGDQINCIYNEHVGICILDGDMDMVDKILELSDNLSIDKIGSVFAFDHNVNVYSMNNLGIDFTSTHTTKSTNDTTWIANFTPHPDKMAGCNSSSNRRIRLYGVGLKADGIDPLDLYVNTGALNRIDMFVDWGDGHTDNFLFQELIWGTVNGYPYISWPATPQSHQYSSGGSKTVTLKLKRPYHTTWVAEVTKTFTVSEIQCYDFSSKATPWIWKYSNDGQRALSGRIETHQNFMGWPVFEAHTKGWKWLNGCFKHRKVDRLVAQIWFNAYTECSGNPSYYSSAEWPYNEKTVQTQATVVNLNNGSYQFVNSNHKLLYNGSYINLDLQMQRCE